jgi:hypothetical protein
MESLLRIDVLQVFKTLAALLCSLPAEDDLYIQSIVTIITNLLVLSKNSVSIVENFIAPLSKVMII